MPIFPTRLLSTKGKAKYGTSRRTIVGTSAFARLECMRLLRKFVGPPLAPPNVITSRAGRRGSLTAGVSSGSVSD